LRRSRQEISEQFGRNLAEARGWARLSQVELADRASLRQRDVSKLESGQRCPRLDLIVSLADVLEVQVRDLLYGIE
jgi:ribosome-binding protein aMBF1 (putative translation factor)